MSERAGPPPKVIHSVQAGAVLTQGAGWAAAVASVTDALINAVMNAASDFMRKDPCYTALC